MIRTLLFFLTLTASVPSLSTQMTFEGIGLPLTLKMDDQRVYIADKSCVWIYSRTDMEVMKTFAHRGQGPGEFSMRPEFIIHDGTLLFRDPNKFMLFSLTGELIREQRILGDFKDIYPLGSFFLVKKREISQERGLITHRIQLLDREFRPLVTLAEHRDEAFVPDAGSKPRINLLAHCFKALCHQEQIFLADTHRGAWIGVYSRKGEEIRQIILDLPQQPAGDHYLQSFIEQRKKNHRWTQDQSRFTFCASAFAPAFQNFVVSGEQIYLISHPLVYRGQERIITRIDQTGNILGTAAVKLTEPWCIHNGRLYTLKETSKEEWMLSEQNLNVF